MTTAARKRELVQHALASAERAHPVLVRQRALLPEVTAAAERCLTVVRAWLEHGDATADAADELACATRLAIDHAWLNWTERPGPGKDTPAFTRALYAACAAVDAAETAGWTVARATRGWDHDPVEARARAAAGPELEASEAERHARLALHPRAG